MRTEHLFGITLLQAVCARHDLEWYYQASQAAKVMCAALAY